jgi:iron complex outermembrane receptor protein
VSSQGQPVQSGQEIVITGSRIAQPNLTSAAPVTVVSDQDIKLAGSTRIEDVLNQLPSVGACCRVTRTLRSATKRRTSTIFRPRW